MPPVVSETENGNYEVGVHIASVTHYVMPRTDIDKEGYNRATSVYLVTERYLCCPKNIQSNLLSLCLMKIN